MTAPTTLTRCGLSLGLWLPGTRAAAAAVLRPAGFVSRLLAFVLDVIIVTIGSVILGALITLVLNFFGLGAEQLRAGSSSQILQLVRALTVALSALGVLLFVPLYFIVFWTLAGATPGKRLLGLRIVHEGQPKLAWSRAPLALHRLLSLRTTAIPGVFVGLSRQTTPGMARQNGGYACRIYVGCSVERMIPARLAFGKRNRSGPNK